MARADNSVHVRLGQRVKKLRLKRGWKQIDLAVHCGFSRIYISQVENGVKDIRISNLEVLAGAFDLSLSRLLTGL
jgi:transcriptional regulator with XRE-family HTH domain